MAWPGPICAIPPRPPQRVEDFANLLDARAKTELLNLIAQVEEQTSAELAVVTVTSLEGMTVEEYAHKIFNTWGIGKKGKDNGVLLLVAPNERKVRIEVGYGLEPILPDGLAGHIIRHQLVPAFKQGDFVGGVRAAARRLSEILLKNQPASPVDYAEAPRSRDQNMPAVQLTIFLAVFVMLGSWMAGGGLGSKTLAPLLFGLGFGFIPLTVFAIPLLPPAAVLFLFLIAAGIVRAGFLHAHRNPEAWRGRKSGRTMGWIAAGSSGGSSSGGGSFGGGGGSFGGGSSGGGGASGSW